MNDDILIGFVLLAVAAGLIFIGRPNKAGVHPRFLQFDAALVLFPPVVGLALIALSIAFLWLCLPSKSGETKPFLRSNIAGAVAVITMTGCLVVGIVMPIAGIV
jgi:hypothetical protein